MAPTPSKGDEFDYIVVGAGTAGCVVAARLSENPSTRVCLIEAGPRDSHPFIHIPATVGAAIATQSINWRFLTVPQRELANRRIPILMCHGLYDPILPLESAERSRDLLRAAGYTVEWKQYPMQHQVCAEEIADISEWLGRVLA